MIDFDDVAFFNTLMLSQLILYIYTVEPIHFIGNLCLKQSTNMSEQNQSSLFVYIYHKMFSVI
jgi:hypothetical protein